MDLFQISGRLEQFAGMLLCCHNLYLWEYDAQRRLLRSNCPQSPVVSNLFSMLRNGRLDKLPPEPTEAPILLTNDVGLLWVVQPLLDQGELLRSYVLGPLFLDSGVPRNLDAQLNGLHLGSNLLAEARQFLRELPVISLSRVFEYAVMLHHCVTGQKIQVSDLRYEAAATQTREHSQQPRGDAHGTYAMEQEMVRMVREGDIENFRRQLDRLSMSGAMGKLSNDDPLRQMKNALITCLVLFSRAAMEGGLDPELSYSLSDRYFQSIEACRSIPELAEIAAPMQEDYIQRVHNLRLGGLSRPIQSCCDYIELHLEEPLSLSVLAKHSGYADYYLSRKFKQETGQAPSEYIRRRRLERAAHLLQTTDEEIQTIAARLQFCSQSHFSEAFRKQYGMTPSAFRQAD